MRWLGLRLELLGNDAWLCPVVYLSERRWNGKLHALFLVEQTFIVNRIPEIVEKAKSMSTNGGFEPNTDVGPLITPEVCIVVPVCILHVNTNVACMVVQTSRGRID